MSESSMNTVNVLYFASIREALGMGSESLRTSATTVAELREEIIRARGEAAAAALAPNKAVRMALNQVMCKGGTAIKDGDEVAFFPPVTGG
ncbi:MAG: molybdopterin converting factor subunit 1 [Burkholderiaceae bacterium]|jgi:molybdopterin synthase sulfur carrier subunit|nr:molybdopterin converting factor subunit 1 [Burkholderiaceae bacterium]